MPTTEDCGSHADVSQSGVARLGWWVEQSNEADLQTLVDAVESARG